MKKRAANFTCEEKSELLDAVLKHRNVLFGRSLPLLGRYWAAKKAAWCEVVDAVNQVRLSPGRNVHECRRKLKDLKAATRKKFMDINGAWRGDADMKNATTEELKILKLLGTEEKIEEEAEIDLSIVKIEPDDPEIVRAEIIVRPDHAPPPAPSTSSADSSEPEIITISAPSVPALPTLVQLPVAPISVAPPATQKVEPIKRPIGQVLPVPSGDNAASAANANATNASVSSANAANSMNSANSANQNLSPTTDPNQGQSLDLANVTMIGRTSSPTESQIVIQNSSYQQQPLDVRRRYIFTHSSTSRPLADFVAPHPLKRIKLHVRNVPTLAQPSTSMGPTTIGNVLNFAICSCNKQPSASGAQDFGMQTDQTDVSLAMMAKIIETQKMTAKALGDLVKITCGAKEPNKEDKSVGEDNVDKVEEVAKMEEVVKDETTEMMVDGEMMPEEKLAKYKLEEKYEVLNKFEIMKAEIIGILEKKEEMFENAVEEALKEEAEMEGQQKDETLG